MGLQRSAAVGVPDAGLRAVRRGAGGVCLAVCCAGSEPVSKESVAAQAWCCSCASGTPVVPGRRRGSLWGRVCFCRDLSARADVLYECCQAEQEVLLRSIVVTMVISASDGLLRVALGRRLPVRFGSSFSSISGKAMCMMPRLVRHCAELCCFARLPCTCAGVWLACLRSQRRFCSPFNVSPCCFFRPASHSGNAGMLAFGDCQPQKVAVLAQSSTSWVVRRCRAWMQPLGIALYNIPVRTYKPGARCNANMAQCNANMAIPHQCSNHTDADLGL